MKLSIYGKGCKKCEQLTANAQQAAEALGLAVEIEKVTDMNAIIDKGVMRTPALGIDGEVVLEGKVASPEELEALLKA
ncbi:thioredoxin family protein [Halomonas rhizosphaerae]|uniref:Thioredoxin family protein n=1 Tax=Halomonas rhizosphaerae TaxID=3043296 RepID=A0ABT6V4Q7_9GAMM|nr:thioredoxin family protein [Halomonas rhizosphaerae]MDI5893236.1 thioredoxin family protein [Halomonas rhizosphaerae]MDI5921072.1 thioredoxin family protein [Halomonas rhizosphaerae]